MSSKNYSLFGPERFFYHGTIRNYVTLFGSLFSDVYIQRKTQTQTMLVKVPIKFGSGFRYEKADQTVDGRENNRNRVLPMIAYTLDTFAEDPIRKGNPNIKLSQQGDGEKAWAQFNRLPYNFEFQMFIRTKALSEMMQIIEQIVPAFGNKVTVRITDNERLNNEQDIVISLNGIQPDDPESVDEKGYVEWTLSFTLRGYLYQRTNSAYILREVEGLAKVGIEGATEDVVLIHENFKDPIEPDLLNVIALGEAMGRLGEAAGDVEAEVRK